MVEKLPRVALNKRMSKMSVYTSSGIYCDARGASTKILVRAVLGYRHVGVAQSC